MKLIEKLANKCVAQRATLDAPDPSRFHLYEFDGHDAVEIYAAGFRKARELMTARIRGEIGNAGLATIGCDPTLGEEEVGGE